MKPNQYRYIRSSPATAG